MKRCKKCEAEDCYCEPNKCEQQGFQHAWEPIENNFVYPTNPPSYPDPQRECINCHKIETLKTIQREIKEWN